MSNTETKVQRIPATKVQPGDIAHHKGGLDPRVVTGAVECRACRQASKRRHGERRRPTRQRRAETIRAALTANPVPTWRP